MLPHLPGGRHSQRGDEFTWYGLLAAGGVAVQGLFLLETNLTLQVFGHLVGTLLFFYGAWCFMGSAQRLYLPHHDIPAEDDPLWDEVTQLAEAAAASQLLQHYLVSVLVKFRHSILMRAPMLVFVIPLVSQFSERAPVKTNSHATTPAMRSLMGLAQWIIVGVFVVVFISYGPEIVVASFMPLPTEEEWQE